MQKIQVKITTFVPYKTTNCVIGCQTLYLESVSSTQDFLLEWARHRRLPTGITVYTHQQYAGKGQQNNAWIAEANQNLALSFLLFPEAFDLSKISWFNKAICVAVREVIAQYIPNFEVQIKWPNDVYVDGFKIAGILIQNQLSGQQVKSTIVGIGINVNQTTFPNNIRAISLRNLATKKINIQWFTSSLLTHLNKWYNYYIDQDFDWIDDQYHQYLLGWNMARRYQLPDGKECVGVLRKVDHKGLAQIEIEGEMKHFANLQIRWLF